jgi:hypothetical protein
MKRIKKLSKEAHTIMAVDLVNIKKSIELIIMECTKVYGFNDKAALKAKRALRHIEDVRSIMDNRFFSEHPESSNGETIYYGILGTSHGAKAIMETQI